MSDQAIEDEHCQEMPWVATASFQKEEGVLLATLDGAETAIPGGSVRIAMGDYEPGGKIHVHLYATFMADAVDLVTEESGS